MVDPITIVILTGSFATTGYFVKKRFDKIDNICKKLSRLEKAIYQIPCVKTFMDKEDEK